MYNVFTKKGYLLGSCMASSYAMAINHFIMRGFSAAYAVLQHK